MGHLLSMGGFLCPWGSPLSLYLRGVVLGHLSSVELGG